MTDISRLTAALADRYAIERELGQGGMATVYLAHDLKHDRKVALKVLHPDLAATIGVDRFLSEIKVTANLQHPNILGLFDSGIADGQAYYVMPYVEGESLRDQLEREKQLPVPDALRIATGIAAALEYAHAHRVIHRDIKPENILLQSGQPVVADFGIALAVQQAGGQRLTQTGMSLGTPAYMSPEQAMGERTLDARTDIYALGVITYEMLAGEPPFSGPNTQAIVARVLTEKPRPLAQLRETVSPGVEAAVHQALQKLPADRYGTAAEFAAALNASGSATAVHLSSSVRAATGWRSRRVRLSLAVGGVAGLIAAAFLVGRSRAAGSSFDQVAFDQQLLLQFRRRGQVAIQRPAQRPAVAGRREDHVTGGRAVVFASPVGEGLALDIARQPHAAGEHDIRLRTIRRQPFAAAAHQLFDHGLGSGVDAGGASTRMRSRKAAAAS